jgi:hypothetical protein
MHLMSVKRCEAKTYKFFQMVMCIYMPLLNRGLEAEAFISSRRSHSNL